MPAETEVHGLGIAVAGLRIEIDRPELERGTPETVAFRIAGAGGEPVRDFDVTHEKRMHLILAR